MEHAEEQKENNEEITIKNTKPETLARCFQSLYYLIQEMGQLRIKLTQTKEQKIVQQLLKLFFFYFTVF